MKKFQFIDALENALLKEDTGQILSILEELSIRQVLLITIEKMQYANFKLLLNFLIKKIDSSNCQGMIFHVIESIINTKKILLVNEEG